MVDAADRLIAHIARHDNALSIVPRPRSENLKRLCLHYSDQLGAFVECGVGRGGLLALMALLAGPDRLVWGFDSFEGLPPLTEEDEGDGEFWVGFSVAGPAGEAVVTETFAVLGVPSHNLRIAKGWFEDTLPGHVAEIGEIAMLRIDADWHRATRFCLDTLYDSVIEGGAVIIDDYFTFMGCRRAVDDFRVAKHIEEPLQITDPDGEVYWFK